MVVQLLTSVLLLVLPSVTHGKLVTISVLNGSASLELSAYPDDATLSDKLTVKINLTSTTNDMRVVTDHITEIQSLLPSISTADSDITFKYNQSTHQSEDGFVTVLGTSAFKTGIVTLGWPINMDYHRDYILVTISISFDNEHLKITNNVIDNRVKIGLLPLYHQCYPKEGCDLTIEISHFIDPQFDVTIELSNSSGDSDASIVFQDTLSVKGDGRQPEQITAPKVGSYHATLSVAKELQNHVYWSNQYLEIQVVMNEVSSIRAELKKLHSLYDNLLEKYDRLSNDFESLKNSTVLKESACHEGDCGDYGTCIRGKCMCKHPQIYDGNYCERHIPCERNPCGSRGSCEKPESIEDMYECKCYNQHVIGKNCTECKIGTCPKNSVCRVDTKGDFQCTCHEGFKETNCDQCDSSHTGDNCEFEKCRPEDDEFKCGDHGDCHYPIQASTNETNCYCYHGFHGQYCDDNSTTTTNQPVSSNSSTPSLQSETPSSDPDDSSNTDVVSSYPNNTLLYGGLIVFIAFLVICVIAYLAYHNKDKIFELFGGKKETIVEMAMRSRTKSKGYKKLPTSIHDTLTHED